MYKFILSTIFLENQTGTFHWVYKYPPIFIWFKSWSDNCNYNYPRACMEVPFHSGRPGWKGRSGGPICFHQGYGGRYTHKTPREWTTLEVCSRYIWNYGYTQVGVTKYHQLRMELRSFGALELPCRFLIHSGVVDINSGHSFFPHDMTLLLSNVLYTFVTILHDDPSSDTYWGTSCASTHTI